MAIMEISILPLGTASTSISSYVADCIKEVETSSGDLRVELTGMGTIVEGDLEELLALARRMHEVPFKNGAKRVVTTIKIDDRRDKEASSDQKVHSVKEHLNK